MRELVGVWNNANTWVTITQLLHCSTHNGDAQTQDSSYLPAYEYGTECSETSEYKIQKPGITQKKAYNIQNTAKVWNQ